MTQAREKYLNVKHTISTIFCLVCLAGRAQASEYEKRGRQVIKIVIAKRDNEVSYSRKMDSTIYNDGSLRRAIR